MPITLALIVVAGVSTIYILRHIHAWFTHVYGLAVVAFLSVFVRADTMIEKRNTCEWTALDYLSHSKEKIVPLPFDCWVLGWKKALNPAESRVRMELLRHWNVVQDEKLFYQP